MNDDLDFTRFGPLHRPSHEPMSDDIEGIEMFKLLSVGIDIASHTLIDTRKVEDLTKEDGSV